MNDYRQPSLRLVTAGPCLDNHSPRHEDPSFRGGNTNGAGGSTEGGHDSRHEGHGSSLERLRREARRASEATARTDGATDRLALPAAPPVVTNTVTKVLVFTPLYLPFMGGVEILVASLAPLLSRRAFRLTIATDDAFRFPARETIDGTDVLRFPFTSAVKSGYPGAPLRALQQLTDAIAAAAPDIIHMHAATASGAWYVDRLLKKGLVTVPFVVTQHGVLEPNDRVNVVRDLLRRADALTGVSEAVLSSALEFSGSDKGRGVIVNGIAEMPRNPSQPPRADRYTLVCVGRLEPEKGFDLAIEALARIRARGMDAGLTVIGEGIDWKSLGLLTEELGLTDYVRFTGPLGNAATRAEIARATAVLVPSRTREGFSLVAAEAAMAGVPVIATRVGGLPETVRDGETGIIIPPDDADSLAVAVTALLEDDERRERLGRRARQRATEIFDLSTCAERYIALYQSLLA